MHNILIPKTLHILFRIFNKNNVVHFASLRNYTHHLSNKIMGLLGMNVVFPLFFFAGMGLIIPTYAQNVSHDEVDIIIRELIQECQEKVMADKSVTEAAKTIAKRNCETEITNEYKNVEIDYKKKSGMAQAQEKKIPTKDVNFSDSEPKIIDAQKGSDKVAALEEKIRSLEEELSKKDEIIREQLKVIMDLANRIKNVMFGTVGSFLMQW